ncbi:MAG TPA: RiPP maturation radical SAM C-methyltransferase [Pyrinomonadaceae bacterium]|nr:RiPP maturation radical SAM C-methyltransferase [Pyrinomonadaceae bacterium]
MTTDSLKPVALISMPSLSARFPSFQLALLKPTLEREGIPVQTFSLFMYFGTQVGWGINETLSDVYPCMLGEWIWTKAAFGDFTDNDGYFEAYRDSLEGIAYKAGCSLDDLRRLRETAAPEFIDWCMKSVDWSRFGVIGFSVVFQQTLASIALAKALKQRYPHIPIMMGGATFEDDIAEEIMKGCPEVDYVHCGDADETLPKAIRRLYSGQSMAGMPGMMWRDGDRIAYAGRAPNLADMNKTPVPDFDEYFYARKEGGYHYCDQAQGVLLPIETARGCWWGVKNHCTFCGLNRAGMEFRSKRVDNVIQQLDELSRRYGILDFNAIDNIIEPDYIDQLFNQLSAANTDIRIHYEVRPSLSRVQLKQMRKGGLFSIQPGVESFSTHILKLMRKHTTGVRNLELIKWSTYYGINNLYNILLRFPGETLDDYRAQCDVISKIPHFQAPWAVAKARADRGSPMYSEPETQSVTRLIPSACYDYLFPKDRFDLNRVSYYFEHEMDNTLQDHEYNEIFEAVDVWQHRWRQRPRPYLRYRKAWATILIEDGRNCSPRTTTYSDDYANLYEYCADARSRKDIAAKFADAPWVEGALEEFVAKDLMIYLDNRYLSLALPENPYY